MTWMRIIHNLNRIMRIRMGAPQMGMSQPHVPVSRVIITYMYTHVYNVHVSQCVHSSLCVCVCSVTQLKRIHQRVKQRRKNFIEY